MTPAAADVQRRLLRVSGIGKVPKKEPVISLQKIDGGLENEITMWYSYTEAVI